MNLLLLKKLALLLKALTVLLTALSSGANPTFGSATVTAGNNYPTSTYSFSDNDIINAGDLNLISTYAGIRSATDTISLQGQIYNVSSSFNTALGSVNVTTATGTLPVIHGGFGTSTVPANGQFLYASGTIPTWKTLVASSGIALSSNATSVFISTPGFDATANINFTGADTFGSSTSFSATTTFTGAVNLNGHTTATDFTSSSIASLAFGQASSTSSTSTASTSFVDLTPSAITMTTGAHRVLLTYTSMYQNATVPNFASVDFTVDGTRIGPTNGLSIVYETVNSNLSLNAFAWSPLLSAGSHTFKAQIKTDTGTLQVNQFQFSAKEEY